MASALLPEKDQYGADGLPIGNEDDKSKAAGKGTKLVVGVSVVSRVIGFGIAFAIYKVGNTKVYEANVAKAVARQEEGGAYVFFSAVVFSMLTFWLNFYPLIAKGRVMLNNKGIRTNMYIYKTNDPSGAKGPCVVLDEDGDVGKYNRANRSMHHFTEYAAAMAFTLICASQVFPFPAFVLVIVLAVGRLWHQLSYSADGYGAHAKGFMLFMISYVTLEMLCLIAGLHALHIL